MWRFRTTALLMAAIIVASSSTSLSGRTSPDIGATSDSTATPSAGRGTAARTAGTGADGATKAPDIGELRVPIETWKTDFSIASVRLGDFSGGGPPRDGIPVIGDPRLESVQDARGWLAATSPVIALEVGGSGRAYPLAIMVWHEIVNDIVGGVPVVVTFCPLCHTALVFDRTVGGAVLDFGTTGNLRYFNLVMYDRQTESWWQQATGEAIVGSMTGVHLTFLPAQIVSLADFAAAHPDGEVLSRDTGVTRPYGQNPYPGYDRADDREFLAVNQVDHRLEAKERVVTLDRDSAPLAVPYAALQDRGVIEITTGPEPIVIVWTPGTTSALDVATIDSGRDSGATGVFVPVVDGRRLRFTRASGPGAAMTDAETGSTWSVTGRAIAGPLTGSRLVPVLHGDHFWFAWASFEPDTEIWRPS